MTWLVGALHESHYLLLAPICMMWKFVVGFSFLVGGGVYAVIGFWTYFDWGVVQLRLSNGV